MYINDIKLGGTNLLIPQCKLMYNVQLNLTKITVNTNIPFVLFAHFSKLLHALSHIKSASFRWKRSFDETKRYLILVKTLL